MVLCYLKIQIESRKTLKARRFELKEADKYRRYHLKKALAKLLFVYLFQAKYCILLQVSKEKEVCTAKKMREMADRHIKEK